MTIYIHVLQMRCKYKVDRREGRWGAVGSKNRKKGNYQHRFRGSLWKFLLWLSLRLQLISAYRRIRKEKEKLCTLEVRWNQPLHCLKKPNMNQKGFYLVLRLFIRRTKKRGQWYFFICPRHGFQVTSKHIFTYFFLKKEW